jgi:hypothetical protein
MFSASEIFISYQNVFSYFNKYFVIRMGLHVILLRFSIIIGHLVCSISFCET